jgi:hypothetical protein
VQITFPRPPPATHPHPTPHYTAWSRGIETWVGTDHTRECVTKRDPSPWSAWSSAPRLARTARHTRAGPGSPDTKHNRTWQKNEKNPQPVCWEQGTPPARKRHGAPTARVRTHLQLFPVQQQRRCHQILLHTTPTAIQDKQANVMTPQGFETALTLTLTHGRVGTNLRRQLNVGKPPRGALLVGHKAHGHDLPDLSGPPASINGSVGCHREPQERGCHTTRRQERGATRR